MSEPLPGSVTVAPNGQTYIYFGGVWGPAEGVTGGIQVDYNSLTVKPETSFNNAVTKIKNEYQMVLPSRPAISTQLPVNILNSLNIKPKEDKRIMNGATKDKINLSVIFICQLY